AAEPCGIRWGGFAPPSRYSYRHSHSSPLQQTSRPTFTADDDAPLPSVHRRTRGFGGGLSPGGLSAHGHSTSELLRTLSRMAASTPPSCLPARPHLLAH